MDQEALEPCGVDVAMDSGRGDLAVYVKYREIAEGSTYVCNEKFRIEDTNKNKSETNRRWKKKTYTL